MRQEEARLLGRNQFEDYLHSRGIDITKSIACPNTLAHKNGDRHPSMGFDRKAQHYHCFTCGNIVDIYDYIGEEEGLTTFPEKLNRVCELYHIDYKATVHKADRQQKKAVLPNTIKIEAQPAKPKKDFTDIVFKAHTELLDNKEALSKITNRGISIETVKRYAIGYCGNGVNELLKPLNLFIKNGQHYKYILPNWTGNKCFYFIPEIGDRELTKTDKGNFPKYMKVSGVETESFNEHYLKEPEPPKVIFITEGIYDALSIEEAEGYAVALNGVGNTHLVATVKEYKPDSTFIISLDNDDAGRDNAQKLAEELSALGCKYIVKSVCTEQAGPKDANELLIKDRNKLKQYVADALTEAEKLDRDLEETEAEREEEERKAYYKEYGQGVFDLLEEADKPNKYIPTGFKHLDEALDGGLYKGLYVIGAISSLGKTTFVAQLSDYIASNGTDVLFFALEMSRTEMIARTVSRFTFEDCQENRKSLTHARTVRQIQNSSTWKNLKRAEMETLSEALGKYNDNISPHLFIRQSFLKGEMPKRITIDDVLEQTERHIKITGNKPVVVIDYLQILQGTDPKLTDKQQVDDHILRLKGLAERYEIPVIAISNFNRSSYTEPVSMESFKESGAIEYGSDVLIGLQYDGMDIDGKEKATERSQRVRELIQAQIERGNRGLSQAVQLKILKNRNGIKKSVRFELVPKYYYFLDSNKQEPAQLASEEAFEEVKNAEPFEETQQSVAV